MGDGVCRSCNRCLDYPYEEVRARKATVCVWARLRKIEAGMEMGSQGDCWKPSGMIFVFEEEPA